MLWSELPVEAAPVPQPRITGDHAVTPRNLGQSEVARPDAPTALRSCSHRMDSKPSGEAARVAGP
jgi:hypothetical protein